MFLKNFFYSNLDIMYQNTLKNNLLQNMSFKMYAVIQKRKILKNDNSKNYLKMLFFFQLETC